MCMSIVGIYHVGVSIAGIYHVGVLTVLARVPGASMHNCVLHGLYPPLTAPSTRRQYCVFGLRVRVREGQEVSVVVVMLPFSWTSTMYQMPRS